MEPRTPQPTPAPAGPDTPAAPGAVASSPGAARPAWALPDTPQALVDALLCPTGWVGVVGREAIALQTRARRLCQRYDASDCEDAEGRTAILRDLLAPGGRPVIQPPFRCDYGFNVRFEGFAFLNYGVTVLDSSPVTIGDGCMVGPGTVISCASHAVDPGQRAAGVSSSAPVRLGRNVWLGANVTVCGGVTIGENSVVGAGSVVTRDVPSGVVAWGAPCRVRRAVGEGDRLELTLPG